MAEKQKREQEIKEEKIVKEKEMAKKQKEIKANAEKKEKKTQMKKKAKKKKKKFGITVKAKKKCSVARAVIKSGSGKIKINNMAFGSFGSRYVNELIREPLNLAGVLSEKVDISVNVRGGGFMSQAVSTRAAIAKALVEFSHDEKLREKFISYDRMLLVDDVRRTESKKPLGKKARKKKQSSKR